MKRESSQIRLTSNRGAIEFRIAPVVRGKHWARLVATTAVVELNGAKNSTASAVAKPFATEITPDDRGYSKFNRFRGLFSQKFRMAHVWIEPDVVRNSLT